MGFRNIFVSSAAKLSVKNNQLVVKTDRERSFPLEDISAIMVESGRVTVTSRLVTRCREAGVPIFFCDEKHIPSALATGYNTHSRKLRILKAQSGIKLTLKKNLWGEITRQKIKNQAKVLGILGKEGEKDILSMARAVKPGDPDNLEGAAAAKYFRYLFGEGFHRADDNITNARLNYGYSVIRGVICRCLVTFGLEPCLGVHHHSELNGFNLADDLIEPFRPTVDLLVRSMDDTEDDLTTEDKRRLFGLLSCDVSVDRQFQAVNRACEISVRSYQASILEGENRLKLCSTVPITRHRYE